MIRANHRISGLDESRIYDYLETLEKGLGTSAPTG